MISIEDSVNHFKIHVLQSGGGGGSGSNTLPHRLIQMNLFPKRNSARKGLKAFKLRDFAVFMAVNFEVEVRNVGILPQHYMASQPGRPRLQSCTFFQFWCHTQVRQEYQIFIRNSATDIFNLYGFNAN
jgi:hypothetical protein